MNDSLVFLLWMTAAGSALALLVLAALGLAGGRLPRAFRYYVWLAVVLRFLLPLESPLPLTQIVWDPPQAAVESPVAEAEAASAAPVEYVVPPPGAETAATQAPGGELLVRQPSRPDPWAVTVLPALLWLAVGAALFLRSLWSYGRFLLAMRRTRRTVEDPRIRGILAEAAGRLGMKAVPGLYRSAGVPFPCRWGRCAPTWCSPSPWTRARTMS